MRRKSPLPQVKATAVLSDLGISEPGDLLHLEDVAWERGVLVRVGQLDGAEARLAVFGARGIITISSKVDHHQRRRFAIAHELGHFELHREENSLSVCVAEDIDRRSFGTVKDQSVRREAEASEFASCLLVPDRFSAPLTRGQQPTLDVARLLSESFDVSLTAAAMAYLRVCNEACAVVYSRGNLVEWYERSQDMEDYDLYVELGPLDKLTIASAHFRGKSAQSQPGRVDAASWFSPGGFNENGTIMEHSIAMPNYDAVLTLLWVDRDIVD